MPGIYSRDNYAQLLANAIENANARRQASLDRSARQTESNLAAIANFGKALGRTYETWGESDEDRLAALQKEREEALIAKKYEEQVAQRRAVVKHLTDPYARISPKEAEPWDGRNGLDIDMGGYKKIMGGGVYA